MGTFKNHKFIKQTRADNTEYYAACVDCETRWFFGLIKYTTTYWVFQSTDGKRNFLFEMDSHYHLYETLDEAKSALSEAIQTHIRLDKHRKVVKVEVVK